MLNISDAYKNAIMQPMRQFQIKVIINEQEIESKYIKNIKIDEISCSGETISIGDVCSNAFELEMFIPEKAISFDQAKVVIKSGLKLSGKITEWVDLGTYVVNEVSREEYLIKLTGYDAINRLEEIYKPDILFNDKTKFIDVLNDILRQCNIALAAINLDDYKNIIIDHYFENITCKELLGYLAGLMGCNIRINRLNELEFYWYIDSGLSVNETLIYQDSYQETLINEFVINSLTSGDEENTLVCGSGSGISFANPYMTQELLDKIFLKVKGFSYQPCSFKWRGNPGIENSDIVKYKDKNIVIMKQTLVLDGGFSSEIECSGKVEDDVVMKTSSPTEIKLNKLYNTLTDAFKNSTETILGQHGGNLVIDLNDDSKPSGWTIMDTPTLESYTKLWKMSKGGLGYSEDGGKTFKKIAFDLNGNFNADIINTGSINGEMFELDLQTGVIKIGKRDKDGLINNPSFYLNEQGELVIKAFEEIKEELQAKKYLVSLDNSGTILDTPTDIITLSAKVYEGNNDETNNISSISFNWYRVSDESENDKAWNNSHKGKRSITLAPDDVNVNGSFYCEITLPIGTRKTQSITITDNNDIANLGNSFLDVTGSQLVQILNTDGTYSPNWEINNITITPAVLDGLLNVDLSNCDIVFKKIINSSETGLTNGENVSNGILNVSKNIMTKANPAVTYVCYVSYKNTSIKLFTSFSLNVLGKDGADGSDGKDGAVGPQGPTGDDGVSVISITPYFAVNANSTTPPDSGWITAQPVRANGQYLWRKDTTKFSNNTTSTTIPFVITGDKGEDAEPPVTEKTISNDTDNVFELTDSSNAYDAEITHIDGDYNQETTNGFQLSDASKLPTKSQGGATVTNNGDGSFTISGSGNLSENFGLSYYSSPENTRKLLKVGTLKAKVGGVVNPPMFINFITNSGLISSKTLDDNYNFEITQEMLDNGLYFYAGFSGIKDQTIQAGTIKPMLYQDGDGTFEPFTGGVASPNPEYPQDPKFVGDYNEDTQKYDIDFMTSGKNLFNINGNVNVDGYSKEQKTTNTVENGVLTCNVNSNTAHGVGQRLYGLKGKTISVSAKLKSFGEATLGNMYIYESSGTYKVVSNTTALDTVFTINNYTCQTDDIVVAFASGNGTGVQFYDIMVNYGAKFVDYEPFTGFETTALQLNQPLRELPNGVKDTVENGIVTRRVGKITFDGSEMWYKNSGSNSNNWMYYIPMSKTRGKGLCNSLAYETIYVINQGAELENVGFNLDHNVSVMYLNVGYYMEQAGLTNTIANLKTWLQSNPITVWYELATPTTEQITLPTLPAYSPYTMVWTNNDVKSRIDLHYYTMFKGDKGDDGTVHSATAPSDKTKLWFDTTDNLLKYWNGTTWEVTNDFAGDINDMKQNITTEYTSAINQLKESLTTLVEKLQTTTTDNSTLIEQLSSQIVQNSSSISLVTNSIKSITDNISGLATKEEISQWARFENGVLELGASNSPFAVKLSNTELGFYQNGSRIAYLSNQQLNIEYAIVMTKLNVGTFSWNYDATDGLTLT